VGILKRLKGSPIIRHTQQHKLRFNPNPPFSILASDTVNFIDVQFMNRFARYWDMIGNAGRFKHTVPLLLQDAPFERFSKVSDTLFSLSGQTHKISLLRLYDLVYKIATETLRVPSVEIVAAIEVDYAESGLKSIPKCLQGDKEKSVRPYKGSKSRKNNVTRQSRNS